MARRRSFRFALWLAGFTYRAKAWRTGRTVRHFAHLSANIHVVVQYKFPFTDEAHQTAMKFFFLQHSGHLMDYAGYAGRPMGIIPVVNLALNEMFSGFAD
jgi:hypothetical protein